MEKNRGREFGKKLLELEGGWEGVENLCSENALKSMRVNLVMTPRNGVYKS